jgi:hypothetical protein
LRSESLEIDGRFGDEYQGKYVFKEITWAKRNRIIQKYTKYHPVSGQVVSSDFIGIQAESIWASLREQPLSKPITLEKLLSDEDGVSFGLGEMLARVVNKLCGVSKEETTFLSAPLDAKSPVQQSPSIDSAKNSGGLQPNSPSNLPKLSSDS